MSTEFKNIAIAEITADPHQPRKYFNELALQELTDSIKAKGIIQPILLRPNDGPGYMLVCGERRLRAATNAGLSEVPAVIRQMGDNEALDLQIIENLQRKDVHPMEEAVAFKSLYDQFTPEEIALRVGKSASYVVKRAKLNDLVPEAQDLFFEDRMTFSTALILARVEPETQVEVLKEQVVKDWRKRSDWMLRNISWLVERKQVDLSSAPFKTNDAKLYPEAGPCNKCPYNSGNQPLLFDDDKKRRCMKPTCFQIKVTRHKKRSLEAIAADPDKIVIAGNSYLNDDEKATVEAAKELGITVLDSKQYEENYSSTDNPTLTYEQWFEESGDEGFDYDTEEEKKEREQENRDSYKDYVEDNEIELKKQAEAVEQGLYKMAYVLTGYNAGKEIAIRIKSAASNLIGVQPGESDVQQEIVIIKMREERNKELDAVKVHTAIQNIFIESETYYDPSPARGWRLTPAELKAVVVALFDAGSYDYREWMKKTFKITGNYSNTIDVKCLSAFDGVTEFGINEMLRRFLVDKVKVAEHEKLSRFTSAKAAVVHMLAIENNEHKVNEVLLEQEGVAAVRAERVDKKLKALKKKLATEPAEA